MEKHSHSLTEIESTAGPSSTLGEEIADIRDDIENLKPQAGIIKALTIEVQVLRVERDRAQHMLDAMLPTLSGHISQHSGNTVLLELLDTALRQLPSNYYDDLRDAKGIETPEREVH